MSDSDSNSLAELEDLSSPASEDLAELEELENEDARNPPRSEQDSDESDIESLSTECSYASSTDDYEDFSAQGPNLEFKENPKGLTIKDHNLYWVRGLPRLFNLSILDYGKRAPKKKTRKSSSSSSSSSSSESYDESQEAGAKSVHVGCNKSSKPYWIGCDSECFRKRGKPREKKLQAFLKNGSLRRGQNFR